MAKTLGIIVGSNEHMDEERKVLPLKEAYRFGGEHGLEQELAEIRDMEIEWDLSYTSSLRRGYVVDLFTKKQLLEEFKEKYWRVGTSSPLRKFPGPGYRQPTG